MGQVFEEKGIRAETRLPESVPRLPGDVDRIIQVILNLLSNAVKFCEPGSGRIEIALAERDGCLGVDVRDNGPGVSAEEQAVIFDKFRHAGDTLTNKPQGTGLGLPISRHICLSFTLPLERVATAA